MYNNKIKNMTSLENETMALDKEEFARRRQERQQQRQKRDRQRKRTLIGLAVAAVVLVACGVLIFVVSRGGGSQGIPESTGASLQTTAGQTQESLQQTQGTGQQTETTTIPTTAPLLPDTVIHFAAAGDLNITDKVVASGGPGYDYTQVFTDVLPVLASADLTSVNLEGNICGVPYGTESSSAPQTLLTALANAGVDMIQTANSFSVKGGISGLGTTLRSIRASGMVPVGTFENEGEFTRSGGYVIQNIKGVKVAVVAFTKGMDGMALPTGSEKCVNLLYSDYASGYQKVNTQGITDILRAVAAETPDVTIALVHWGSQYNEIHSKTQETIRKLLIEEGADAIIGTHPHLVQELLFDEEAGTFVAYSLGDLLSDAERAGTAYSIVLDLEITKNNNNGQTKITGYSYTPVYTVAEEEQPLRVVRLEQAIRAYEAGHINRVSEKIYSDMLYSRTRVEDRVKPKPEAPS